MKIENGHGGHREIPNWRPSQTVKLGKRSCRILGCFAFPMGTTSTQLLNTLVILCSKCCCLTSALSDVRTRARTLQRWPHHGGTSPRDIQLLHCVLLLEMHGDEEPSCTSKHVFASSPRLHGAFAESCSVVFLILRSDF